MPAALTLWLPQPRAAGAAFAHPRHTSCLLLQCSRPGTSQMEGSISPSSYPQHFRNEMSFVVTTTSVRGNKRKSDPDGLYGSDKDMRTNSRQQGQGRVGGEMVWDEWGSTGDGLGIPVVLCHTWHIPGSALCAHTQCHDLLMAWGCSKVPFGHISGSTSVAQQGHFCSGSSKPASDTDIRAGREQGARRDGLGQHCRTAGNHTDPCLAQHPVE